MLLQEKHREKKHKKEKRDRERREGKEKREKDRSDEKHREKKDKKEKQKDKKRDKEKDKDKSKDKSSALDEKRHSGKTENHGGEKLVQNKDKENNGDKRFPGQFAVYKAEKLSQKSYLDEANKDSKLVQELGRRIKDEAKGIGNQFENFNGSDPRKDEGMVRLVAKSTGSLAEGKEKNKHRRVEDKTTDGQGVLDEAKTSGNAMLQNTVGIVQTNFGGLPRQLDKNVDSKIEGKEKEKDKKGDDKRGDKRKDKDKEKKNEKKDKDRDKEKKKEKKEKKAKEKIQIKNTDKIQIRNTEKIPLNNIEKIHLKNTEPDKLKESSKGGLIGFNSIKTSSLSKDSNRTSSTEGNLKKRKDFETNGVLHAYDIKPSKLPRPASFSHPIAENGRILEPCQNSVLHASDRQGTANDLKMDNKERKINGVIGAWPSSVSPMKHASATAQADPIAESSSRPPHPDSKYLNHIYAVPIVEQFSDCDDQEWLFSGNDSQLKKSLAESSAVKEAPQVWAEALQMESADVYALPYVVPY
ncbi:hypothetical protein FNV43_RR01288 [Rhamnella rubrinervis]|uniref:Myb-like protein X n=1 Tax=Rhamnella rubrinervis TaxID=2594499 RepID=A0A8K0MSQ1_9ROSA|nr:hypothetical protein FNV43_RR01288 [Rhamnella rubrinervis]